MDGDQPEIWVLGNLTIDDVVTAAGTISMNMCGGNAIYAAAGARVWSDRVGLCARVGSDFPREHLQILRRCGIQLELAQVAAPSIRNWALYEGPDTRRFIARLGSGSHLEQSPLPRDLPPQVCRARVCHIAPMPLSVQQQLVQYVSRGNAVISLDPHDEYLAGQERAVLELLSLITVFLPSRQEARLLFGRDAPEDAARAFVAAGARVAVVKLGAEGSLVCEMGRSAVQHVPAVTVPVVDPTGAGDAFCGAFGVIYARSKDVLQAALYASVAASFVVERHGATSALPPDRLEAQRRLQLLTSELEGVTRACAWTTES